MSKELPENLFLMYPVSILLLKEERNAPLLADRWKRLYYVLFLLTVLGVGVIIISFCLILTSNQSDSDPTNFYGVTQSNVLKTHNSNSVGGLLILFAVGWGILLYVLWVAYRVKRRRILEKTGQIFLGKLVRIKGSYYPRYGYIIRVSYQFKSPAGIILKGTRKIIRNDLKMQSLPPPHTPVAILYINDTYYDVL